MPRNLKTYQTSMGFFDLAVAAPSMKAALEAWGSKNNLFHQGFAQEVDDIDVVAATMKRPGVVLKRPVGSDGPFLEQADLPASLPAHKRGSRKPPSTPIKRGRALDDKAAREAAKEYEREERKRDRERAKLEAERARRERAISKVEAQREKAKRDHENRLREMETERAALDRRFEAEELRWKRQMEKFQNELKHARK